jgi:hypothetical protein
MKPKWLVTLATWILEHLTYGTHKEAIVGDLLEELRRGRSARWYWRQVLSVIGVELSRRPRDYTLTLIFSAAWSTLYPFWWHLIGRSPLPQTLPQRWAALDWPYSGALALFCGVTPAVTFIWLGLFAYLISRLGAARELTGFQVLRSLSVSLNVLLVANVAVLKFFGNAAIDIRFIPREDFYATFHLSSISVPLVLSLFFAIAYALPPVRHRRFDSFAH